MARNIYVIYIPKSICCSLPLSVPLSLLPLPSLPLFPSLTSTLLFFVLFHFFLLSFFRCLLLSPLPSFFPPFLPSSFFPSFLLSFFPYFLLSSFPPPRSSQTAFCIPSFLPSIPSHSLAACLIQSLNIIATLLIQNNPPHSHPLIQARRRHPTAEQSDRAAV
ncbi:hypothetical protein BKA57DRAFT_239612 [Linnemannia elongata]|nr:hypothetical protein BKA57DRAFT_239612 [Linnemannia elongata]